MKNLKRIPQVFAFFLLLLTIFPVTEISAQHMAGPGELIQDNNYQSIRGLVLNIVYTQDRYSDAMNIADILRRNGVNVKLTNTGNTGNLKYDGKILYKEGYFDGARVIADLVRNYESVTPEPGTPKFYNDKQFNLWVTTKKNIFGNNLSGLIANIVYTQERYADALSAGSALRRMGVQVKYTQTTSGKGFQGKVLYRNGFFSQAQEIARVVEKYEKVIPQLGKPQFYKDKHFNIWVTTPKGPLYTDVRNLIVNIVHTDQRYGDALNIGRILRQKGMIVKYTKTPNGNSFVGKILFRQGYDSTARYIADIVRNYERVTPQFGNQNSYRDKHFNLWVTSPKYGQSNNYNSTNLSNLVVNIVYTQPRFSDALNAGKMLRQRGMIVKYTKTTSGNTFEGKILYRQGYDRAAMYIADLVRNYESVTPQFGNQNSYRDKHFNLWITKGGDQVSYNVNNFTNLQNLVVNIVYTQERYADALDAGRLLRQSGMLVKYTKTTSGNTFAGKILYRQGYDRAAQYIAELVGRYEYVTPQFGNQSGYKDKHFNLWITR